MLGKGGEVPNKVGEPNKENVFGQELCGETVKEQEHETYYGCCHGESLLHAGCHGSVDAMECL